MSLTAECPYCGRYAKDNSSPSAEWRDVVRDEWQFIDSWEERRAFRVARQWLCPCSRTLYYWPDDSDRAYVFTRTNPNIPEEANRE